MSTTQSSTSNSTGNDPDAQFLKDLEEAKRLSLQTYQMETHRHSDDVSSIPAVPAGPSSTFNQSNFADFGKALFSVPQQPSTRPIGFVMPQPQLFPFDRNGNSSKGLMMSSNSPNVIPSSSSNISNNIPGTSGLLNRSQSFPYPFLSNIPTPPTNNTPKNFRYSTAMSPAFNANFGFEKFVGNNSTTKTFDNIKTDKVDTSVNSTNNIKFPGPDIKPRALYSNLSNQVKSLTEDLIDLGQDDGRNILESFDPLFEPVKEEVPQPSLQTATPAIISLPGDGRSRSPLVSGEPVYASVNKRKSVIVADSTDYANVIPGSSSSAASGWKSDISLYPTLPPVSESLYGSLEKAPDQTDQSMLYDNYSHFEYLAAVSSISSESSFYYQPYGSVTQSQHGSTISSTSSQSSVAPGQIRDKFSKKSSNRKRSSYQMKRRAKLYENITNLKKTAQIDSELLAFVDMLQSLRMSSRMVSSKKRQMYINAPTAPTECWKSGLSLKIIIWTEYFTTDPATFTSEVSSTIGQLIDQALAKLEIEDSGSNYILRVKGRDEYMESHISLISYRYCQECIKLDEDVRLVLVHRSSLERTFWSRSAVDNTIETSIQPEEIMPACHSKVITFADISGFLENVDKESDKITEKFCDVPQGVRNTVNPTQLLQTVKGICVHLGNIQPVEIYRNLQAFASACDAWNKEAQKSPESCQPVRRTVIGSDVSSRHSFVEIVPPESKLNSEESLKETVLRTKENVIDSVNMLIEMYSKSFPVSFQMKSPLEITDTEELEGKSMSDMLEPFVVRVSALHRMKPQWLAQYKDYFVNVEVFHGTRWMGTQLTSQHSPSKTDDGCFFSTVIIDSWLTFDHLPMCILPRECRLVFSIVGRAFDENGELTDKQELGWASIQCFDFQGNLVRGNQLLPLWPVGLPQKWLGPAPNSAFSYDLNVPLITIEFPDFGYDLKFPAIPKGVCVKREFESLDINTQNLLKDVIESTEFKKLPAELREILWEKRHYLHNFPLALPKVLSSAQLWDFTSLSDLQIMMDNWAPLEPANALQLLLPCFPDAKVRQTAIKWIAKMPDEDLVTILPQLVEALSYETFDLSPLAQFLLKKSMSRFEITHSLFWSLASEVGIGRWLEDTDVVASVLSHSRPHVDLSDPRRRRLELMLNSLLAISYHKWKSALISQFKLMQGLCEVTASVKEAPVSQRSTALNHKLKRLNIQLFGGSQEYILPLSPAYNVVSIDVESCICFNSASVPLKINFKSSLPEGATHSVLFKQGDDIRQDMLTIQVIRMIETWWLKDGLDLRVVTFTCVPTGPKQGVVEIVCNAETLCKIQADYGVTGAFRNRPISEWLAKMNPSTLDYRRAVENFTHSCAAYCVLTYVLGICDRHNDNIMLTNKGHLFHIDFGKFLGDAQMFGSFKRDRAPFVLTSDMLYVINDGEKSSQRFHQFVELCCQAFKIVRQHGPLLENLFTMMATAGIPGVDATSVAYINNALLPDYSNVEAAAKFTRFIEDSLRNWFTPVNFFIHSLAQLRFASDNNDNPATLSFMPKMYRMDEEGRIESAHVMRFQKKYDPEKYYSYTIKVKRKDQTQSSYINRSYKQFLEFYTKLCMNFPMAVGALKALPRNSGIGRSNVKQVAEKRTPLLQEFLDSLFKLADEIAHSELVYTFFHPLLQDEEYEMKDVIRGTPERILANTMKIQGCIEACLQYSKGALIVLIKRALNLACPNGQPPSAYVKSYLQPDPRRLTKRKTRVVKQSHPLFYEMIEYRLPLEVIKKRTLQLSVWHHDSMQENSFLGGVSVPLENFPLENETTQTFTLGNLTVT